MAVDGELRNLVAQTLETRGVLGKIRAELRASVFLALDDQGTFESPLENKHLKSFLATENGMLVIDLVREFLDFFHLDYTKSVLEPETSLSQTSLDRATLARKLNLAKGAASGSEPLLGMLLSSPSSSPLARQPQPAAAAATAAVVSTVCPGNAADGGAFFSPSSRLTLTSSIASGRTSPGELDYLRSGGGAATTAPASSSSLSTYHARSTATQPSVLSPLSGTAQATAPSGPSSLASYGLMTGAAVTDGSSTGVQSIAPASLLHSAGDGHGTAELLEFIGIDPHSRSDASAGAGAAVKQSTGVTADNRDSKKKRKLPVENLESSASSANSSFASNHSGSDVSSVSINSDSRGQAGFVHDATKTSATGTPTQHKYSDEDSLSSRSHASSVLSDVQNNTLTGSGSDSSWLSRPAGDLSTNNLDTSDHSISQLSDGDFSYVEDVQT